ncbi:hypothetical protein [Cyclobacterium qasimii]|uniref:Uncharacterized protein n=2 Tax=Cyclobacterium qasimii TaxID=1350429 RepID=S7VPN6_9BACT|nr:hypothetical protein [Cyclobacterium qasimii]EPR71292.1 hypothetical protein ADICYQ_0518 [Cyclobacterium qasimii M12-11B]GEO23801.1 hypothetical protein CQA01_43350 [Cyclobacterium qasimii]
MIEKVKSLIKSKIDEFSLLDTGWDNRPYDFYLIFGQNDEDKSPWIKSNWENNFESYFDKLIKQTETADKTGIRVVKYKPEKQIAKKDKKEFIHHSEVKTGRLNWDSKSHEKWTIESNLKNYFLNTEIWTPRWTICEKRNSPPDIFISISNERDFEDAREIKFGYFIVVAIAKNLKIASKSVMKEMAEGINSKATIAKSRKWGRTEKAGNWTFVNGIQHTFSNGIYKGGNLHTYNFEMLIFEPTWKIIYKEK